MSNQRSVEVRWGGRGTVFEGRTGDAVPIQLDSDSVAGPSPMESLLMALAACMAVDIKMILEKGRVPVEDIRVDVEGDRAEDPPRRYVAIRMRIVVAGPGESDSAKLDRAVRLSQDKYCSVFHSLRSDLDVSVTVSRA